MLPPPHIYAIPERNDREHSQNPSCDGKNLIFVIIIALQEILANDEHLKSPILAKEKRKNEICTGNFLMNEYNLANQKAIRLPDVVELLQPTAAQVRSSEHHAQNMVSIYERMLIRIKISLPSDGFREFS